MSFTEKISIDCKKATLLALQQEDGRTDISQNFSLFFHIKYCEACKRFQEQSLAINKAIHQYKAFIFSHPTLALSNEKKVSLQQLIDASYNK